jgi:maltose alpha-D-glucosyltransferase/alpha-amylase
VNHQFDMKIEKATYIIALFALVACHQKAKVEAPVDAWYKHLLIYNLDVKTYKDSDGDGEGDFKGLTTKLAYLQKLGVNAIWLAPFQPSPLEDDGYDVSDYYGIDPKLGTAADFSNFMAAAKAKHFKVIMDLVLNHSSISHPWFRSRPNWYLWSKEKPGDWDKGMGFPHVEKETWRYDSTAHQYYFHRFYHFEPDLNYQNPAVLNEAKRITAYWLDRGLDGFRLDAVPFIIDDPRKDTENPRFDFEILHELTGFIKKHKPGAVLLGEANVEPEENEKYFAGHHEGLQMMFNFYANQFLFYGLATGDVGLFKKALKETELKPGMAQWAWFLRNHDEIDLGRLSKHQLSEVEKKMGPDTIMQLYGRGIRRRLATMLNGNQQQLRLAYSLLYALPGTPVIRQGEEIGMGDNLGLKERLAIRTPMQWDSTANAGFTSGRPFRPVIAAGTYGYQKINIATQKRNPRSLLNFIKHIINVRKQYPEIDNGKWQVIDTGSDDVLVLEYTDKGKAVRISHNFSARPQQITFNDKTSLILPPYGFKWQRLN